MLRLLFFRHAQSEGNRVGRMQGQGFDRLSAQGEAEALTLGRYLTHQSWRPSHIYVSPLPRAMQTLAQMTASWPDTLADVPVLPTPELQELHLGILQGLTWAEAQQCYPALCQQLEMSPEWLPIPEAESLQSGRDRAQILLDRLLQKHSSDDRLWLISHAGILQHLIAVLLGSDRTWGLAIPTTALFEFQIDLSRWHSGALNRFNPTLWQIHRFNDRPHLK